MLHKLGVELLFLPMVCNIFFLGGFEEIGIGLLFVLFGLVSVVHKSIATTKDIYSHVLDEMSLDAYLAREEE